MRIQLINWLVSSVCLFSLEYSVFFKKLNTHLCSPFNNKAIKAINDIVTRISGRYEVTTSSDANSATTPATTGPIDSPRPVSSFFNMF